MILWRDRGSESARVSGSRVKCIYAQLTSHLGHCGHVLSNLKPFILFCFVFIAFAEGKIIVNERKTLRNGLSNRSAMLQTI